LAKTSLLHSLRLHVEFLKVFRVGLGLHSEKSLQLEVCTCFTFLSVYQTPTKRYLFFWIHILRTE